MVIFDFLLLALTSEDSYHTTLSCFMGFVIHYIIKTLTLKRMVYFVNSIYIFIYIYYICK